MINGKKILAVVPARGGSKGIKLKNLRKFNGVPLVSLVGEVIGHLDYIDRAVVSTDHPEIAKVAAESGLDVPFLRPENISGDRIGDMDVLYHALIATEEDDKETYDVVIMLQPTSPSRKPEHITLAVKKLIDYNYDAVWSISESDTKTHPLKQLTFKENKLDFYDKRGRTIIARQQLTPLYYVNGIVYAFTRDCILNQKEKMAKNTSAILIKEPVVNIDTEMDFRIGEFVLNNIDRFS